MGLLKNVLYFITMGSDKINRESRIQNKPEQKKDKAQTACCVPAILNQGSLLHAYVSQTHKQLPLSLSTRRNGKMFPRDFISHLNLDFQQACYTFKEKRKKFLLEEGSY